MSTSIPLHLLRENGKKITVSSTEGHDSIGVIVWGRNDAPKLPLELSIKEARGLRALLDAAIATALKEAP